MNSLQKYLIVNAIFSILNGGFTIIFRSKIEEIFNVKQSSFFFILGLLLLFFALTIIIEVKKLRALPILWIIIQDMLWVIGSIVLLIWNPFDISSTGNIIIGIVALIVLQLGLGQARGLARIDEGNKIGQKIFRFSRVVEGDKSKVWKIISDVENYHKVAPNIDDSKIISGEKKGMVRSCFHGKDSWKETCTLWEDEQQYSFVVNTEAPDYPYPLRALKGTWMVDEISQDKNEITMVFEFEYKKPIQNIFVHPLMKYKFTKVCEELLDNWQKKIEN
ncbi:type II toxin-antitoxin system RatA family toxin [Aquimarina spongiae]|uniref:Ribosome association toxin PasT (RatA) of the RatAB toxin-antitoxin module n=1 Tax=Aquimarina spongiae TaxID=570521 RepID=A0A1M6HEK8_9FLAO|nr:SRPBCC family protein [Aquimarina spongiae]SHJ20584.1 Ribosome association toxin PasT (RatA) of the RatAB toxin-antitoxin module [Aquimarina spongiae]